MLGTSLDCLPRSRHNPSVLLAQSEVCELSALDHAALVVRSAAILSRQKLIILCVHGK
jgi:hypothetical protein